MLLRENTFTLRSQEDLETLKSDILPKVSKGTEILLHLPNSNVDYSSIEDDYKIRLLNPLPRPKDKDYYGIGDIIKDLNIDCKVNAFDQISKEALDFDGVKDSDNPKLTFHVADLIDENNFDKYISQFKDGDVGFVNRYMTYRKCEDHPIYSLDEVDSRVYSFERDEVPEFLKDKLIDEDKRLSVVVLNQYQIGEIIENGKSNN